jgi:hypothetical protein
MSRLGHQKYIHSLSKDEVTCSFKESAREIYYWKTGGGRSVRIVRWRTQATEFSLVSLDWNEKYVLL